MSGFPFAAGAPPAPRPRPSAPIAATADAAAAPLFHISLLPTPRFPGSGIVAGAYERGLRRAKWSRARGPQLGLRGREPRRGTKGEKESNDRQPRGSSAAVRGRAIAAAVLILRPPRCSRPSLAPAGAAAATKWLCKPGAKPNPCKGSLETTVFESDGSSSVKTAKNAKKPKYDCFYVYPTVSEQPTPNANKDIDPQQIAIASTRRPATPRTARSTRRSTARRRWPGSAIPTTPTRPSSRRPTATSSRPGRTT